MTENLEQLIDPTDISSQSEKIETEFAQKAVAHLANWDETTNSLKNVSSHQFEEEESRLLELEKMRALFMRSIAPSEFIGNQHVVYGDHYENLKTWGALIGYIDQVIGQNQQFNILVTGLPISGKATLRRAVAKGLQVKHPGRVCLIDRDYIKRPQNFILGEGINIIEDMHGLDPNSPNYENLSLYNMILYLKPSEMQQLKTIAERGKIWQESKDRKVDLTDGEGTGDDKPFTKFMQSAKSQGRAYQSREDILQRDAPILDNLHQRIPVIEIDPATIIDLSYQK